jgi:hypothetical protein
MRSHAAYRTEKNGSGPCQIVSFACSVLLQLSSDVIVFPVEGLSV